MRRTLAILSLVLLPGFLHSAEPAASPFQIRGTLPWHNFLSGPTAWNEEDYAKYLDRLKELGLNYVAFHCYTGGAERYATYVEPLIRIEYRNVVPRAGFDTSITARWGYRPLKISQFAFDTGKLFPRPEGVDVFGAQCAVLARTNEERYQKAQALLKRVIEMAHERGIQVALGFEFGIHPPEFASIVPPSSWIRGVMLPDPTQPASIEILHNTIDDILRAYPHLDWIWLWLHEHSMQVGSPYIGNAFRALVQNDAHFFTEAGNEGDLFTGIWSLAYIRLAQDYLARRAPKVRLAISGWGGGRQLPSILQGLDRALPTNIVFSCLNPSQGWEPQPDFLSQIAKHREVWAIPWLEGDARLWHLQPRVSLLRDHVRLAQHEKLNGVIAIHWRTEEMRANLKAFALFAQNPSQAPTVDDFYRTDCEQQYGAEVAKDVAAILAGYDKEQSLAAYSPEYYPYDPSWGRLKPELRARLTADGAKLGKLTEQIKDANQRANLDWLKANFEFTLLLDEVSQDLEPAYVLKDRWLAELDGAATLATETAAARKALSEAPIEKLFRTYAGRVRSRGELGELSSINQKLGLEYRELKQFLDQLPDGQAAK